MSSLPQKIEKSQNNTIPNPEDSIEFKKTDPSITILKNGDKINQAPLKSIAINREIC